MFGNHQPVMKEWRQCTEAETWRGGGTIAPNVAENEEPIASFLIFGIVRLPLTVQYRVIVS